MMETQCSEDVKMMVALIRNERGERGLICCIS